VADGQELAGDGLSVGKKTRCASGDGRTLDPLYFTSMRANVDYQVGGEECGSKGFLLCKERRVRRRPEHETSSGVRHRTGGGFTRGGFWGRRAKCGTLNH